MFLEEDESHWIKLAETDSTNAYLLRGEYDSGTVVLAQAQTSGRGRQARPWYSRAGGSFIFSGLYRMPLQSIRKESIHRLSLLAGFALIKAIRESINDLEQTVPDDDFCLKWPNDLLFKVNQSWGKLGGILIEMDLREEEALLVIGAGLNWEGLPDSMDEIGMHGIKPACLFRMEDEVVEPFYLGKYYVRALNHILKNAPEHIAQISAEQHAGLCFRGARIEYKGHEHTVSGMNHSGGLILTDPQNSARKIILESPENASEICWEKAWA